MPDFNIQYQVTFILNGHVMLQSEWSCDREKIVNLVDAFNHSMRDIGYRAFIESRGSQSITASELKVTIES